MKVAIVGAGRAGTSFAAALDPLHHVTLAHHGDLPDPSEEELVLLCVPDDAIGAVSDDLEVSPECVVAHVAGSRGLEVLSRHARRGSLHPLASLPNARLGAPRLCGGVFAVEGDGLLVALVDSLGGRAITVATASRPLYHATAVASANHLVALMGHVQALAEGAGLRLEDFVALARQALDDVAELGPLGALTGPASRGDLATLNMHLDALPLEERATYKALAQRALRLAQQSSGEVDAPDADSRSRRGDVGGGVAWND